MCIRAWLQQVKSILKMVDLVVRQYINVAIVVIKLSFRCGFIRCLLAGIWHNWNWHGKLFNSREIGSISGFKMFTIGFDCLFLNGNFARSRIDKAITIVLPLFGATFQFQHVHLFNILDGRFSLSSGSGAALKNPKIPRRIVSYREAKTVNPR